MKRQKREIMIVFDFFKKNMLPPRTPRFSRQIWKIRHWWEREGGCSMWGGRRWGGDGDVESYLCFFFNWASNSLVGWGKTLKFPKFLNFKMFRHINKFFCVLTSKNFETECCLNSKLYKNKFFKRTDFQK